MIAVTCVLCFSAQKYVSAGKLREKTYNKAKTTLPKDSVYLDEDYLKFYDLGEFDTTLPVLFIETDDTINGDSAVYGKISIINDDNDGQSHSITQKPDVTINAGVKYRGASSKHFDKRQYRISFYKSEKMDYAYNYDLLGMGKASEWVLHGPFLDKTLARNYMVYNLSSEIMEWAPECRYVELFENGKYKGVYLAVEPVTNGEGRLRLSTFGLLNSETSYILARDRVDSDINPLNNYGKTGGFTSNNLYVLYPGGKSIMDEQYKWIENDISRFEKALYGDDFADPDTGYAAYIDVDNFVDYYIINEVVMNHDAGNLSTYVYKELGGKLMMAVWDYNNSYDNYQWFAEDFSEFYLTEKAWFHRLVKDKNFIDKVVERYKILRQKELSTEHMFEYIDSSKQIMGTALGRNFKVWGYTFYQNQLVGHNRDITSYEGAVSQLKDAIKKRFDFLDSHIGDLYKYCE